MKMNLIRIKNTKRIKMYHVVETGDVIIKLMNGDTVEKTLTIPERNIYSVIRGLLSDRQRFHRRKFRKRR